VEEVKMSKNLTVKVTKRVTKGEESWEGTVNLPGVAPTKLVKSKTNESKFTTRNALTGAAQRLASRYGFADVKFEGAGETTTKKIPTRRRTTAESTTLTGV
jgi:hypothetical protein